MQTARRRLFSFSYERRGESIGWYPRLEREEEVSPEQPQRGDQVWIVEHDDGTVWIEVEREPDASINLEQLTEDDLNALRNEMSVEAERLADEHFKEYLRERHPGAHLADGLESEQIKVGFREYVTPKREGGTWIRREDVPCSQEKKPRHC